jgi:hypothetical protein
MRVACWSDFPCRVYIDSNHRNSRIWVTACLWPSARGQLTEMKRGEGKRSGVNSIGKEEIRRRHFDSASQRMAAARPAWVRWRQHPREEGDKWHTGQVGYAARWAEDLLGHHDQVGRGRRLERWWIRDVTLLRIKSRKRRGANDGCGLQLCRRGYRDWADVEENKGNSLGREKGFRA